jgi:uncharacterized integral membrane protein
MNKLKIAVAAIVAVLLIIVILQNTQQVETRLLFVTIAMPRAVLLITALVVGFVIGLLAAGRLSKKPS